MSDETVVDVFVGDFENKDKKKIKCDDMNKLQYFPREGVRLKIAKVPVTGKPGEAYAKIEVSNDGGTFEAKEAVELAVFRVVGQSLVATDMELKAGMLLTETLTMRVSEGKKEMVHALSFSDKKGGEWICEP